jgi:hypothetical protein
MTGTHFSAAHDPPVLGPVQVVPPQGRAAAPAGAPPGQALCSGVTWQPRTSADKQDHFKSKCPRFQGNLTLVDEGRPACPAAPLAVRIP